MEGGSREESGVRSLPTPTLKPKRPSDPATNLDEFTAFASRSSLNATPSLSNNPVNQIAPKKHSSWAALFREKTLPKIWKLNCSIQIIDLALRYFCFKFSNRDDMESVLSKGPWFLGGQVLLLTPWRVNFQPMFERIDTFPGLPVEYMQREILHQMAVFLGQPIKIDEVTLRGQRAKFARICVLWDLSKIVPNGFGSMELDGKISVKENTLVNKNPELDLLGPWQAINRKKRPMVKKKVEMEVKTSNGFKELRNLQESDRATPDLSELNVFTDNNSKMDIVNAQASLNPFKNKGKEILKANSSKDQLVGKPKLKNGPGMKLLSWNIRGGLKISGWDYLTILKKKYNFDMILLLETHLDEENSQYCIKKLGQKWTGSFVPGNGRAGGILFAWKIEFCEAKLKLGLAKKIGNGVDTDIMGDPWIGNIPFNWWPTYIDTHKIQSFKSILELTINREWNNSLIAEIFGPPLKERIQNIYIPNHDEKDKWIWSCNEKGKLNSKIAYNFLKENEGTLCSLNFNWKWLWNALVIPKAKTFAWKLLLGRLPTTCYLSRFTKVEQFKCFICNMHEDSSDHILFKCEFAMIFWNDFKNTLGYKFEFKDSWHNGS
ncbi:hypothetical protein Cni_G15965 [Canna indica]|uniref:Reverse transcriptase zinc-binding domain-containing protein n=1 Tax=Canna indica TaxID=4628 RepID=A0AAQ3KEP7_9LILI|nr:hypothetical protein Cni_G15965 [Canna indica]